MRFLSSTIICSVLLLLVLPAGSGAASSPFLERTEGLVRSDLTELGADYRRFYGSKGTFLELAGALAVGGFMANTDIDREWQEYYRDDIRSSLTDDLSDVFRIPGEILFTVPALVGVRLLAPDNAAGDWAQRSLRALFVGAPLGYALQRVTGGSRPNEGDSNWRPFRGDNGLSGHSFIGGVPFLTAAAMVEDPYVRGALYFFSTLPALSRINDDKHYASQALLGWYLAWLSVRTVNMGEAGADARGLIQPVFFSGGGGGLAWSTRF